MPSNKQQNQIDTATAKRSTDAIYFHPFFIQAIIPKITPINFTQIQPTLKLLTNLHNKVSKNKQENLHKIYPNTTS